MIEIKLIKLHSSDPFVDKHQLFVDGKPIERVSVDSYRMQYDQAIEFQIHSRDYEASATLIEHSFSEFPDTEYIYLRYKFDWFNFIDGVWISRDDAKDENYEILFDFGQLPEWRGAYSFVEYYQELSRVVEEAGVSQLRLTPDDKDGSFRNFGVFFYPCNPDAPISTEIARFSELFRPPPRTGGESFELPLL